MSSKTPNDLPEKTASALRLMRIALVTPIVYVLGLGMVIGMLTLLLPRADVVDTSSNTCDINALLRQANVTSGSYTATAEIVDRPETRNKGLSDRNCLEDSRAMLFVFESSGNHCFWMKDMNFSIDMIWFNEQKQIITIASGVRPESYPQAYCPEEAARYVLEVPSGVADRYAWQKGQQFNF